MARDSSSDPYVKAFNSAKEVSDDRASSLLEVLSGSMQPVGINEEWKQHLIDCCETIINLRLDLLEHEREKHRLRKQIMETRDHLLGTLHMVRRLIDGINSSDRREPKADRGVEVGGRRGAGGSTEAEDRRLYGEGGVIDRNLRAIIGPPCPAGDVFSLKQAPGAARGVLNLKREQPDPGSHYAEDERNAEGKTV